MRLSARQQIKRGVIGLGCMILGVFVASLLYSQGYQKIPQSQNTANLNDAILTDPLTQAKATLTAPEYSYYNKDIKKKPVVSAEAYIVGDLQTGDIIIEKNQDKVFPIASVSKLMTATVATDMGTLNDPVQVSKQALATEGQNGDFRLNEKLKKGDILYPLLLESSNDAAEAIAISSGRDFFLEKMNEKAKDLGLLHTGFKDPSGLSEQNHSTTSDLFKLAKYIFENKPDLFKITLNKSYINPQHVWFSTNQFLKEPGYIGGKSGYIDESKQTVISLFSVPLARDNERKVAITLLRSNDRKKDVQNILAYLKKNIFYGTTADVHAGWVSEKNGVLEVAEPEIKEPDFVTLAFLGDIMLDRGVRNSVNKNFNGDYSKLFEKMDILKKSDIVFANLEGPASDKGEDLHNLYSFQMDSSVIPALKGGGIDVLSVANNHVGDYGILSYIDTLKRLKENEIQYTGGGNNSAEAEQPTIVEKYGMKIGYLGFSDVGPEWMKASADSGGLLLANNPRFDEIIANASKKVDYLIVSFHFGVEYQKTHTERQEYLAHRAVDDGAKLVIGSHPHVVEDTEVYKNSFIAYSLGNFIFDQPFSADTMQGMLLEIKLNKDGSMTSKQNTVKLSRVFQPDQIILGKETPVKFQDIVKIETKI